MAIHPTAIIGDKVTIGNNVDIGPYVVIDGVVSIGDGTTILAHSYITGWTTIGKNNRIHMGVILGHEPQDVSYNGQETYLEIGDNNVFREHSWIHRGTKEGSKTIIGNNNYFMGYAHAAHNCIIGNNAIIASNTLLAGHVEVGDQAFVSGNIVVHQFCRIGRLAMISGLSAVNKDVPPFITCGGRGVVPIAPNSVGLKRAGIGLAGRTVIKNAFRLLFNSGLNVKQAIAEIKKGDLTPEVQEMIEFIESSKRGICNPPGQKHANVDIL
ncbi:MAG: acyl-ACP--UDP-N-acetylglucosamine O-acyltransferase [Candidatus Ancaeobacter aquaticus]|nr:acyl-ACP--UDP-N-acetylglucosamine O-acyltransferase [Candidatus Ancaeobacter aquaticus]